MNSVSQWPAGTRFSAGLGVSVLIPPMDWETYSEAGCVWKPKPTKSNPNAGSYVGPEGAPKGKKGLFAVGTANYAMHPSTDILSLKYDLCDGRGIQHWTPHKPNPQDLFDYVARGGLVDAWNSGFEWWIWNFVCVRRYGWPEVSYRSFRCSMAKSRASGYPGGLGNAGMVMRLANQKDKTGEQLLDLFSIPQAITGSNSVKRHDPATHPRGPELYRYNEIDVISETEAALRTPDLEGDELEYWLLDQLINRRGVHVDKASLDGCVKIVRACLAKYDAEICALTNGVVERASQMDRLKEWLLPWGINMGSGKGTGDDEAVARALKDLMPHPPGKYYPPRRALELRQLTGSASVKKVFSMANQLSGFSRLHDLFNYHGARTGRPTGEGPQPTNLPKSGPSVYKCVCGRFHGQHKTNCPWCGFPVAPTAKKLGWDEYGAEAIEDVLEVIRTGSVDWVEYVFGDALLCVSGSLRGLFTAPPGHDLIASDFTAIEAVVTACLAGEDWRVDVFKGDTSIYLESASRSFGVSVPEMLDYKARTGAHHPLRDKGKRTELGLGFGGWINALRSDFIRMEGSDDELKKVILAWRAASPAVVEFWGGQERGSWGNKYPENFGLEGMAVNAILNPGVKYDVMRLNGTWSGVSFICKGEGDENALYCILPSGRALTYRRPRLEANTKGWGGKWHMYYEGWNSNPMAGPLGWVTMAIYSGKWCENVVQATARDLQVNAKRKLEAAGYRVVLHVYDEDVVEAAHGWGSIEEVERLMMDIPAWATYKGEAWPIKAAGGWRGVRYRKA